MSKKTLNLSGQELSVDKTRQRIVEAAAEVFIDRGYARATTRVIAARAEVNEVTLFRHFGNKRNLFRAVVDTYSALPDLVVMLEHQLTGDCQKDLLTLGNFLLVVLTERRGVLRLMLCEADQFPEVGAVMVQIPHQLRLLLAKYLDRQIELGRLRSLHPELMAQAFLGEFFSFSVLAAILGESLAPELNKEELVAQFVDMFMYGTAKKEA